MGSYRNIRAGHRDKYYQAILTASEVSTYPVPMRTARPQETHHIWKIYMVAGGRWLKRLKTRLYMFLEPPVSQDVQALQGCEIGCKSRPNKETSELLAQKSDVGKRI